MSTIGLLYYSKDKKLVYKLRVHFASLMRQGHSIVEPGDSEDIEECDVLLVLLSPYFLAQQRLIDLALYAVEQDQRIVPIMLRDIDKNSVPGPIINRQCLPRNGKPVARQDVDRALSEVHREVSKIIEEVHH